MKQPPLFLLSAFCFPLCSCASVSDSAAHDAADSGLASLLQVQCLNALDSAHYFLSRMPGMVIALGLLFLVGVVLAALWFALTLAYDLGFTDGTVCSARSHRLECTTEDFEPRFVRKGGQF